MEPQIIACAISGQPDEASHLQVFSLCRLLMGIAWIGEVYGSTFNNNVCMSLFYYCVLHILLMLI